MKKEELVTAALTMVGTPFHAQGRMPGAGLDCIGVIACVARICDIPHQDKAVYPLRPNGELQPALEAQMMRVVGTPQPGDILLMAFDGIEPHHVAMYVGDNQIVHAYITARKVVKQQYTAHWRRLVVATYRFPGVE
jgi:cell wall-associated NlpC family hydrolase